MPRDLCHCTGRIVVDRSRPQSQFDHDAVFAACRDRGVAVAFQLPPGAKGPAARPAEAGRRLGCHFSIDTDAHAPRQLEWQYIGCDRAAECGVTAERVINAASSTTVLG